MKSKKIFIYVIYFILIFVSLFISTFMSFKNVTNKVESSIEFVTQGGYNYTVNYKENELFTKESLHDSSTKKLPGKLINKIDINFDYHVEFSDSVKSNVLYSVNTKLIVGDTINKSFPIETNLSDSFQGKNYDLSYVASIDYNHYKEIYNNFINEMGVTPTGDAYLSIEFAIINKINYLGIDDDNSNTIKVTIPISDDYISITKNSDINTNKKTINRVKDNNSINNFYSVSSIFMWIVSLLLIFSFSLYHSRELEVSSPFKRKIARILREYDSIIVEVRRLPSLEDLTVIETTTFNELLDAQSSLEMPINYKLENNTAKFVIVKDNLAYYYNIKENKKV